MFVSQHWPLARMTNGRCNLADDTGKVTDACVRVAHGDCKVAGGICYRCNRRM